MARLSGVEKLLDDVKASLASWGVGADVSLGWKQATKQTNQGAGRANRVVFIPSEPNGAGGKIVATKQPGYRVQPDGTSVRALYDWERAMVVSIWAVDKTAPADEGAQILATENLFEQVMAAVQYSGQCTATWGSVTWTPAPVEHMFGRELRAQLTLRHPMFDRSDELVEAGFRLNRSLESPE